MDRAIFFYSVKENEKIVNKNLSFAFANFGYRLLQAIIEYLDNAIDANASEIAICFENNRILIIDNGEGLENIEKFFDVPIVPKKRNKQDIGLFSCGTFSAFCVANGCSFISRTGLNKKAQGINIMYDPETGGIENKMLDEQELETWCTKYAKYSEIFKNWKSIVVIEDIYPEKNDIDVTQAQDALYAKLGQRYLHKIKEEAVNITVWNMHSQQDVAECISKKIEFVDPTFYSVEQKEIQSFHSKALEFTISMAEVGKEMGEEAVNRYYKEYISHFQINMSRKEFDAEKLSVRYYVLQPVDHYNDFIKNNSRYEYYRPGGKSASTGFYIYRNGIGIGDAVVDKSMEVDMTRQEYNRFKAVIDSSPAFDKLLGINVHKDKLNVVKALTGILKQKLEESIANFLNTIPNGQKYKASKLGPYIRSLFNAVDELDYKSKDENDKASTINKEPKDKKESKDVDRSQLNATITGIELYAAYTTSEVVDKINKWKETTFQSLEEYSAVLAEATAILNDLKNAKNVLFHDLDQMLERTEKYLDRREVISEKYMFLTGIDEPHTEQETVFFLLHLLKNAPYIEEIKGLELDKVLEYNVSKGLDYIGITTESAEEYESHIKAITEWSENLDADKIYNKYKLLIEHRYCSVEVKYSITNGKNIEHSLATSRFLVAWKTTIGTDGHIVADDGIYDKVEESGENNGIYIHF